MLPVFAVPGSFFIGMLGAMLGIGGGPVLVPFLIFGLTYPLHVAGATSQFTIALSSAVAAMIYLMNGNLVPEYAIALSLGVLVGSALGAWASTRIQARNLVFLMSEVLLFLGLRLIV